MSVALWLHSHADLDKLHQVCGNFKGGDRVPCGGSDGSLARVDIHVVAEPDVGAKYPVNELRNAALERATCEFVLSLDVDFVGNVDMLEQLDDVAARWRRLERQHGDRRIAVVVPAFEVPDARRLSQMPDDKRELIDAADALRAFQVHYFKGVHAHQATDYERWLALGNGDGNGDAAELLYPIDYDYLYEPYVLIRRSECPQYDERFIGYGNDKASHIYKLNAANFQLLVAPHSFIVHRDHGEPAWRNDQGSADAWEFWWEFIGDMRVKYPQHRQAIPAWLAESCFHQDCPAFWLWTS
jgi:glycosyltransferase-like protein LARGE